MADTGWGGASLDQELPQAAQHVLFEDPLGDPVVCVLPLWYSIETTKGSK